MNREPVTITIKVEKIPDFISELEEIGAKKIYRNSAGEYGRDYKQTTYTVYDPEKGVFIKANIVFPEIQALCRMDLGDRYHTWDFGHDATCSIKNKRRFAKALKALGVSPDVAKQYNSVKVEELHKLIDDSELEEGGASITTIYRQGGELTRTLECNFMGCVNTVLATVKIEHGSMSYKLTIPNWAGIFAKLCEKHEAPLDRFHVVAGSVSVQ
jgi:hypothetical protein